MKHSILAGLVAVAVFVGWPHAQQPPPQPPTTTQQPSEIGVPIVGDGGGPPRLAVPDFIALSPDAETVAIAKILGQVLWDDLNFEHEFAFIPRDVYASIPKATSFTDVPFDRWRELNADGLVIGTVQKVDAGVKVEVRLFEVRTRRSVFGKEYTGAASANPRRYAHMVSDDLHLTQRALRGVAQTRITFASDRDGERMKNTVQKRDVKEIYIADYDGERQTRVTVNGTLNVFPRWSPDGRSIAYTSYGKGTPQILISNIFQATREEVTKGSDENWLAAWSPDGTKLCIASPREGKGYTNLYIVNRDGSGLRKLTNHPSINTSPTWSPSGTQIAFSSDRTANPQVYVIGADGVGQAQRITVSESYADKPTWSPAPYNEIAYTARTGPGNDIKVIDMATREVRQLTFGEGSNESPAFAPNGRHIAFTSTRAGKKQIFTISRTGRDLKQLTRVGNNEHPDWSAK